MTTIEAEKIDLSNRLYDARKLAAQAQPFAFALNAAAKEDNPGSLSSYYEMTATITNCIDELLLSIDYVLDNAIFAERKG